MVEFWNSLLTEKSWNRLLELQKEPFNFIVIGGWAIYLWTKLHKSKDIDIVLTDIKSLEYLKQKYDLKKNEHFKRYEISMNDFDIDIYVPYFSKLPIPTEDLSKYTTKIEGISVLKPEALLILKQATEIERKDSVKGTKDRIDILSILCYASFDTKEYFRLIKEYKHKEFGARLKTILKTFKEYFYLNMNVQEFKKKKKELLEQLNC